MSTRNTPRPSGVIAGTTSASAIGAAGTEILSAVQQPRRTLRAVVGLRGLELRVQRVVHADLGERGGEDRVALHHRGQPALPLIGRAELGDRERPAHDRRPVRDGRDDAALLLEHERELGEPEAAAADVLGQRDAEQVRVRERLPEVSVDAVVARLDGLDPLDRDRALEDLLRQVANGLLLLAQPEVHLGGPTSPGGTPGATGPRRGPATRPRRACPPSRRRGRCPRCRRRGASPPRAR